MRHHLEEVMPMVDATAGCWAWEAVTCCRLLALEGSSERRKWWRQFDAGAVALTTAKAQASATACTEARAPDTEPTA